MICALCDKQDWNRLDQKALGLERQLSICKGCGFIAYEVELAEEQKLKDYYRREYRGQIGPKNLETTTRKLNYVRAFMEPWLAEQEKANRTLVTVDVGCATGYVVDFFRRRGHKATGCEWTLTMRRFAEHFYGIPVTEEVQTKFKYDVITMYHVLEHMTEPDKKLKQYADLLSETGRIMVSTPEWLGELEESGFGYVSSFPAVYHKDHINVFTRQSLKNLFAKCQLVIEREDHITYGQTYLLRRGTPEEVANAFVPEPWEGQMAKLLKTKEAIDLFQQKKYKEALLVWPAFPDVYFQWIFDTPIRKDAGRTEDMIKEAETLMPANVKIKQIKANFLYQHERYEEALREFDWLIQHKITEDYLVFKGWCLYHMGQLKNCMFTMDQAYKMNPAKYLEAMTWICKCATELKTWDEVAVEEFTRQMRDQGKLKIEPKDKVMDTPVVPEVPVPDPVPAPAA